MLCFTCANTTPQYYPNRGEKLKTPTRH